MILNKGDVHGNKVLTWRWVEAFITSLVQRIPNKHTNLSSRSEFSLVRAMVVDIGCTSKHPKGNIRDVTSGGIGFFNTI